VDQHVGGDGLEGVARFRLHRSLHLVIALCGGLGRCKEKQVCPARIENQGTGWQTPATIDTQAFY
jgi:hypothetical protein